MIKKITAIFLAAMMMVSLPGCGGKKDSAAGGQEEASQYGEALEVLQAVVGAYSEEDLFAIYGGDQENAVMDAPGKFDVTKTEELDNVLGLPNEQASAIDDAASMVHMMNANIFTGAVYRLKEDTDKAAFAEAVKTHILGRQWICGQPDTLLILDAGGRYVLIAFGEAGIMEIFKNNALSALDGAQTITEAPIG